MSLDLSLSVTAMIFDTLTEAARRKQYLSELCPTIEESMIEAGTIPGMTY
jgi:hypothetical protein